MRVAILSRPGGCFPNIISQGLSNLLNGLNIENKVFYDAIPFLMRLLPFNEKPIHWSNNFHFRVYNKLKYFWHDKKIIRQLKEFDMIILSECLPNALWKNYLAIEELRKKTKKKIGSYTDGSISVAPRHKQMLLIEDDYGDERFDFNLFVSDVIEEKWKEKNTNKAVIGINLHYTGLKPSEREDFFVIIDFAQKGYEKYREHQLEILKKLGINTVVLEGRYELGEIRDLYKKAAALFLSFPETIGLPIAECLACGTLIFTPKSSWPMAWRLNEDPKSWGEGDLPACFKIYKEDDLEQQLIKLQQDYNANKTPFDVFEMFIKKYPHFYYGDSDELKNILNKQFHP